MSEPLNLLDLPIEILSQILTPFLSTSPRGSRIYLVRPPESNSLPFAYPGSIIPILLIHPRIHAIAIPILYSPGANPFLLDLTRKLCARTRKLLEEPILQRGTLLGSRDALRRVRYLRVKLDTLRGWMGDKVAPILEDMILRGQLEYLTIHLSRDTWGGHSLAFRPERLAAGQPLERLLQVLADPDLDQAKMFIEPGHAKGWCQFHKSDSQSLIKRGSLATGCNITELDWRSMLREVNPTGDLQGSKDETI